MGSKDYYQLLGLTPEALAAQIKRAFRQLSLKYHPDKTDNKSHHELFLKVSEAYEILSSPESKRQYDVSIGVGNSSININVSKSASGHGYYGFYQTYYRRPDESFKQAEAEKKRFEQEKRQAFEKARAEDAMRRRAELREAQLRQAELQREAARKERFEQARREQDRLQEQRRQREEALQRERERIREHLQKNTNANNRSNLSSTNQYNTNQTTANQYTADQQNTNFNENSNAGSFDDAYEQAKQWAYVNAQAKPNIVMEDELDQQYRQSMPRDENEENNHGRNSSDPIILSDDDDDDDDDENGDTFYSTKPETPENDSFEQEKRIKSESLESNLSPHTPNSRQNYSEENNPLLEEEEEEEEEDPLVDINRSNDDKIDILNDITVNLRPKQIPSYMRNTRPPPSNRTTLKMKQSNNPVHTKHNGKRAKMDTFALNELHNSLGTDIENVDYKDILDSLPNDGRRKPSDNLFNQPKRQRVAEFSNGTLKVETLHTPINRNTIKGHIPKLTISDLHGNFPSHDPPTPPQVVIEGSVDEDSWQTYVINVENYEKHFLQYKKHMIQYLQNRDLADEENFAKINGNPENFKVYHACLEQDLRIHQDFTDQLRKYTTTMQVYHQNRNWIDRATLKRRLGLS
jgi:curved DNA-binding protein CbpA